MMSNTCGVWYSVWSGVVWYVCGICVGVVQEKCMQLSPGVAIRKILEVE